MFEKRDRTMLFLILPLIALVSFSLWFIKAGQPYTLYDATGDAQWDLTQVDFDTLAYTLQGDIMFIPDKLLTPDEFDAARAEAVLGGAGQIPHVCTSRIRVLVPKDMQLMLLIRSIDFNDRIYVNGALVAEVGYPSLDASLSTADKQYLLYTVAAPDGVLEIVQQTSNYVHKDSSGHTDITIGSPPVVQNIYARLFGITAIVSGCFLALLLTHLVLYLLLPSHRVNLYATLFCLIWFVRNGVTGIRLIPAMLPGLPWAVLLRLEYLSLPTTCVLMTLVFSEIFLGVFPAAYRRVMAALAAAYTLVILFAPTMVMSRLLVYYEIVIGAGIAYTVARLAIKLRHVTFEQGASLSGLALLLVSFVHEMFFHTPVGWFPSRHFTILELSLLLYIFIQSTLFIADTVRRMTAASIREKQLAAEKALLEEMDRYKMAFFSDVSHEMKTPLAVIAANAQLAASTLRAGDMDAETPVDMDIIAEEAKRLAQMVESLIDLNRARDQHTKKEALDMGRLIESTARMYGAMLKRRGNTLLVEGTQELPPVWGDADRLTQVLINLLTNANRHTEQGTITIAAERLEDAIAVTVRDTGEGIDPAFLPLAFERFSRDSAQGVGLGLAICKEIIEKHGGTIGIESSGEGTAVRFALPTIAGGNAHA